MDMKWLEDFLSLSKTGHFRQSSKERHISQPAFSRRIRALEAWIGAELIDRSTFPAKLTDAGVEFRGVAENMLQMAHEAQTKFRKESRERQHVTFACMDILGATYMPKWLRRLEPKTGRLNASVLTGFSAAEEHLTCLEDGSCDFLVCYKDDKDAIRIDPSTFPSLQLGIEKIVPVASPDALAEAQIPPNGTTKHPVPFLSYLPRTYLGRIVIDNIKRNHQEIVFHQVYETTIAASVKEMALLGRGLGWLPLTSIESNLADGSLVRAAPRAFDIEISVRIFRFAESGHKSAEALWSILQEEYGREDTPLTSVEVRWRPGAGSA